MHRKASVLESLFNKFATLQAGNFIAETPTQVFFCEYCEIFKTFILKDICERLFLNFIDPESINEDVFKTQ